MKPLKEWIGEFSESHKNANNIKIHEYCIPLIFFSIVSFLESFHIAAYNNIQISAGLVVAIIALIFYACLGLKTFVLMLVTICACRALAIVLQENGVPMLHMSIAMFSVGWLGQYYGHYLEGKKPSFFQDLKFLLIAPLWIFYR